jgi:hypothetical protein
MADNKFRASYTVLNLWASGNWQRAIEQYFKLADFVTPAMVEGRDYHKKWSEYIQKNKNLPLEFGGTKLTDPVCEDKKVVSIYDWLDLVFIIDCYDRPTLYEFKTGKQSSEAYASSMQLPVYAVGATMAGLYVEKAEIHHYDQYVKRHDVSLVWVTDKMLENGHNWIVTIAGEMQNYFLQNGLYERFGAKRPQADTEAIINIEL